MLINSLNLIPVIADCGGLLGVFLGFSFIGAIDFWHKIIKSLRAKIKLERNQKVKTPSIIYVIPSSEKLKSRQKLIAGRKPKYSKRNFFLL